MGSGDFSGERFIPDMNDPELEIEHLERYYAVQPLVTGMDVLDAACGEGYGSCILAASAKSVIGIDIDDITVQNARLKYGEVSNLQFAQGSIADLSMIGDASKDAVISFETIEHVDRELQTAFLKEIKRILKPEGFVIMSTPDKKEYSDRYQFHNQFHVAEFYVNEFVDFLKSEFQNVKLYNQYLEVASFIDQAEIDREQVLFVKDSKRYNPVGKYVIAVAGNSALPLHSISSVFMHHKETYLPTLDELNYCRHEAIVCREKAGRVDQCENENKLQAEELERRQVELEHRMALINELEKKVMASENANKLQAEELERRRVELEHRMVLINELEAKAMELESVQKQLAEELEYIKSLKLYKVLKCFSVKK